MTWADALGLLCQIPALIGVALCVGALTSSTGGDPDPNPPPDGD